MTQSQDPARDERKAHRMPVLFAGHGSPMNAIEDNRWSRSFSALGERLSRPRAILAVSAHWFVAGTYLTSNAHPKTIHDFGGFPQALFEVQYPAKGDPALAKRVRALLNAGRDDERSALREDWGLDHGTWSVLKWIYPHADIPVVQLSIDRRLNAQQHFALASSLKELRYEGVLILGSGNIVHNLRDAFQRMQGGPPETPAWAARFDETVKQAALAHDSNTLLDLWSREDGKLAHPTPEHWWPLIYALGLTDDDDAVSFPTEGFDWGSLSMRNILWG